MFTKSLITIILSILCLNGYAQSFKVSGKVVDSANNPLEYVTISVQNPSTYAEISGGITDVNGKFSIESPSGEFILYLESFSGDKLEQPLTVTQNVDLGTIKLGSTAAVTLEGAVITGSSQAYRMELDKKIYDVSKDPSNRGASVSDALQNVPSVQVDGEGNISLRGNENVRILIDGKPSGLVGISDPAKALESLPADAVERIEVVTNPSSRYEAEGTAGIINIILKKGKLQGLNGSVSVNGGIPEAYGASANLNYRTGKWNVFTNLGYRNQLREGENKSETTRFDASGTPRYEWMNGESERRYNGYNFMLGTEYYLDQSNTFTVSGSYRKGKNKNNSTIRYEDFDAAMNPTASSIRTENEDENDYSIDGNFSFKHEFLEPGHVFTVDARATYSKEDEDGILREVSDLFNSNERSISKENERRVIISADYVYPFGKHKLEIGARGEYNQTNTLFKVDSLGNDGWINKEEFSSHTQYNQNVYAGYVQYGTAFGNFNFMAGLRAENSQITVNSILNESVTRKNYVDFFPSLFLNYEFNPDNQLQVSYSRRIRRPRGWDLIPFTSYSNNRNIFMGNPYLDPQFTDSYELSYITKIGKLMITPNVYYSHTTDNIQRYQTLGENGVLVVKPINAGTEDRFGGDLTFSYRPFKWWNLMGNVNVFGYKTEGSVTDTYTDPNSGNEVSTITVFDGEGTSWFGRLSTGFNLPSNFNIQIMGHYRGGQKTAQSDRKGMYGMDVTLSKDLFNENATLSLNVRDVFNSRRMEYTSFGENFIVDSQHRWSQRTFNLTFTYRFNQSKRDQKRERQQMPEDGEGEMF